MLWIIVGVGFVTYGIAEDILWSWIMIIERCSTRKDVEEGRYRREAKKVTDRLSKEVEELREKIRVLKLKREELEEE